MAAALFLLMIGPWVPLLMWLLAGIDLDPASWLLGTLDHLGPASLIVTLALTWALSLALLHRSSLASLDRLLRGVA